MSSTLSLERARFALGEVNRAKEQLDEAGADDYAALCRRLPAMIVGNGLGQALAYLLADDEGEHKKASWRLYDGLSQWLIHKRRIYSVNGSGDLMDVLVSGDRQSYVHAQRECMELLVWLKRFADARIGKPAQRPEGERL